MVFTLRNLLIAAAIALAVALGIETDWGDALGKLNLQQRGAQSKGDGKGVLPDFKLGSDASAYGQIVERPLLNPSRRPAPTQPVAAVAPEPPKPQIRRGLYLLAGISDLGTVKVAQLRELGTARPKSVKVGDTLQEMTVTQIDSDSVTLAFMGETDVLTLPKFTASGRVPQPAAPPQPSPQPPPQQPVAQIPSAVGAAPPGTDPMPPAQPAPARTVMGIPVAAATPQPATDNAPRPVFPGAGENSPIPGRISVGELLEARRRMRNNQ